MRQTEALELLGLTDLENPDSDDIMDAYMEQLLPIKQYWLTNPVVELLFRKRLAQVAKLHEALVSLNEDVGELALSLDFQTSIDDAEIVRIYEAKMMWLKMVISSSWGFPNLNRLIDEVISVQHDFENRLLNTVQGVFNPEQPGEYRNEDVKIGDQLSTIELQRMLGKKWDELSQEERYKLFTEVHRIEKRKNLKKPA